MKRYSKIANFDGAKFAVRYGLDPLKMDFWADENFLYVNKDLPDDPPIFDAPDSPLIILRRLADELVDNEQPANKLARAIVAALLDELNTHALKINSILNAVDAATSLADLKTRIGAISDYPQRTLVQAKDAIKAKINAGDVD